VVVTIAILVFFSLVGFVLGVVTGMVIWRK